MSIRLPHPRLSFRWQITMLGVVVVVLFVAVLIATLSALQYTKSAVLNNEKRRLFEAANELARNYLDRAKSASQARGLSSVDFSLVSSSEAMSETSQSALQKLNGIGGGFYRSNGDVLFGYPPAASRGSEQMPVLSENRDDVRRAILGAARNAANTHMHSDRVLTGGNDIMLIEAAPIGIEKSNWGSAWTIERLQSVPGSNRLRAYLITAALGVAALVCVLLTLWVVRNLQAGVRKIESSLQDLESDLT